MEPQTRNCGARQGHDPPAAHYQQLSLNRLSTTKNPAEEEVVWKNHAPEWVRFSFFTLA